MKQFQNLLLGAVILVYGVWAYTSPIETLTQRYGESGLTWGILVFGLLIPYSAYLVLTIFQFWKKGKSKDPEE